MYILVKSQLTNVRAQIYKLAEQDRVQVGEDGEELFWGETD